MKTPPIVSPLENFEYKEANRQSINDRYQNRLRSIPAPGSGCHVSLLGVANLGIMARKTHEQIFSDIRQAIPRGRRKVSNREIQDAIQRASRDHQPGSQLSQLKPDLSCRTARRPYGESSTREAAARRSIYGGCPLSESCGHRKRIQSVFFPSSMTLTT